MDGPAIAVVQDKLHLLAQDVLHHGFPGPEIPFQPLLRLLQDSKPLPIQRRALRGALARRGLHPGLLPRPGAAGQEGKGKDGRGQPF